MMILTKDIEKKMRANHALLLKKQRENDEKSFVSMPVVKLFGGACTWLLSELDDNGYAYGLCDLGLGFPELGYVQMDELMERKFPPFGLPIERDRNWKPEKTLVEYADEASENRRIIA